MRSVETNALSLIAQVILFVLFAKTDTLGLWCAKTGISRRDGRLMLGFLLQVLHHRHVEFV